MTTETTNPTTNALQSLLDYAEERRYEVEAAESSSSTESSWTRGRQTGQIQA